MIETALQIEEKELKEKLRSLSLIFSKPEPKILEIGILTNIAMETLPNYKNYKYIVSGISQARMMKGVSGKRGIESQIQKLMQTYELEDINESLIESAAELMVITFDSIFSKSGKQLKEKYITAMQDIEFLYINLRLAVKIIAETLKRSGVNLNNKTLDFVTTAIKREKNNIAQKYIEAYVTGDENAIILARNYYRETMETMLNNFIKTLSIPYEDAIVFGEEQTIVKILEKENLDKITGYLLFEIKERVLQDSRIQRKLFY